MKADNRKPLTERIEWPDVCRGLAILWVVLVHCNTPYTVFDQFVIAAFFFVSGFVTNFEKGAYLPFVGRKFASLMVPFFWTAVAIWLLLVLPLERFLPAAQVFQDYLPEEGFAEFRKVLLLYGDPQLDVLGATWFLCALFFGLVLARTMISTLSSLVRHEGVRDAALYVLSFVVFLIGVNVVLAVRHHRWFLDLSLVAQFFLVVGWICRKRNVLAWFERHFALQLVVFVVTAGLVWWFSYDPPHLPFAHGKMNHGVWLSTFAAFNGIASITAFSMILVRVAKGPLAWVKTLFVTAGRDSLGILFLHFVAFKLVYLILWPLGVLSPTDFKHVYPLDPKISAVWWPLFVLVGSVVPIVVWKIVMPPCRRVKESVIRMISPAR